MLFRALGYKKQDIIKLFYPIQTIHIKKDKFFIEFNPDDFMDRIEYDVKDEKGEIVLQAGKGFLRKKPSSLWQAG